ncbi:disulfide oxidoreductase [Salimicrobium halophilum]|uniref:Disulfide bond formation protein DsbB n=1 Tax=Salimicrobium halophilum TaxID=86666 RepID=A0A1G8TQ23_9BACI|nr:disulfide oxidoreductase [Salimicrobium halophilum]SDJ43503.1 disulfide bond formation protein DsbB [Salimicrobium halophilum]
MESSNRLFAAWAVALTAMLGSLFYSEFMGYTPCEWCWYQRILMYPLVIIYGAALLKNSKEMAFPGLILSGIGVLTSTYHYLMQKVSILQPPGGSCGAVPCTVEYVNYFGFITIPFLAGTAFIIIFISHVTMLGKKE